MLEKLEQRLTAKLDAIRARNVDRLTETTHDISRTTQQLDLLAAERGRQMETLGQTLGAERQIDSLDRLVTLCDGTTSPHIEEDLSRWRTKMREQARRTQERCEEVTFALQYATRLGQEMLQALRGQMPERGTPGTDAYTSAGTAAPSSQQSSLVNHVG